MDVLQIVLSSVVIVALINMAMQYKSSQLQYVMCEREKRRNDIKKCAEELGNANKDDIKKILSLLKANLNAYGCHNSNSYPIDLKLNFLLDEHIWKEINLLEQEYQKSNCLDEEAINKHKENLIVFLSQLLTFDINKSTAEISDNRISTVSVVLFITSIIANLYFISKQQTNVNYIQIFIFLVVPYLLIWIPYWLEVPNILKTVKWYKKFLLYLICWCTGIVFAFIEILTFRLSYSLDIIFPAITMFLLIISMFCAFIYVMSKKNMYKIYDDTIMRILGINQMLIFGWGSSFSLLRTTDFFAECGINCCVRYGDNSILNDQMFILYYNGLSSEEKVNGLNWRAKISYKFHKKEDIYNFIKMKPSRCKLIVKYEVEKGLNKFSLGYQKKEWMDWIEHIKNVKD